jgi:hypothetical protein
MPGLNLSFDNDNTRVLHGFLQSLKEDSWIAPQIVTTASFHILSHSLFTNQTIICYNSVSADSIIKVSHKHIVDHGLFQPDYTVLHTIFISTVTISWFSVTHPKYRGCNVHQSAITPIQNANEPQRSKLCIRYSLQKLGVRFEIFNTLCMHHNPYSTQSDSQNTKIGIPKPIPYSTAFLLLFSNYSLHFIKTSSR